MNTDSDEFQSVIDKVVQATGIDLARKTDYIIKRALQKQAPKAFWLLSHFPFRWLARLLRFEIVRYQQDSLMAEVFEVRIYGRTIEKAKINISLLVQ